MPDANNTFIRLKCGYCDNEDTLISVSDLYDRNKQQIQCPECKAYLLNRREPSNKFTDNTDTEALKNAMEAYANHDFEKACEAYSQLMAHSAHRNDPEVYWQYLMCYYGIVWIEDEAHGDVKPVIFCPRSGDYSTIDGHPQYDRLMELARAESQEGTLNYYRSNARRIKEIQLAFERMQTDYDVFLCCKKYIPGTDTPAPERKAAYSLKEYLEGRGLKVFIDDVIPPGVNYEAYILAALRDSRLMLVFASCREYLHSPWVQNEWERFLWLMSQSESSTTVRTGLRYIMPVVCGDMQFEAFEQGIDRLQGIKYTRNIDWTKSESLRDMLNRIWPAAPTPAPAPKRNGSLLKVLSVLVVIALAAGGGWMASSRSRQTNAPERTVAAQMTAAPAPTEVPTAVPTEAPTPVPTEVPTLAPTEVPAPGDNKVALFADGTPVTGVITVENDSLTFSWTAPDDVLHCNLRLLDSSGNIFTLSSQNENTRYELSRSLLNTLQPGEIYTFELTAVSVNEWRKAQAQFIIPAARIPEVTLYADGTPASGIITVKNESLAFSWTASGEIQRCDLRLLDSSGNIYTLPSQTDSSGYTLSRTLLSTLQPGEIYTFQLTAVPAGNNITEADYGKAQAQFIVPAAPADDNTLSSDTDPLGLGSVQMQVAVQNNGYALVRSGTGNGSVITSLENGASVQYLRQSYMNPDGDIWLLVNCGEDRQGWISSAHARFKDHIWIDALPDSEPDPLLPIPASELYHPAVITGKSVRIRKGPSTGNDTLTTLSKGDAPLWLGLTASDEQDNIWYFVCCDDMQTGWVSSDLCEITYDPQPLPSGLFS